MQHIDSSLGLSQAGQAPQTRRQRLCRRGRVPKTLRLGSAAVLGLCLVLGNYWLSAEPADNAPIAKQLVRAPSALSG